MSVKDAADVGTTSDNMETEFAEMLAEQQKVQMLTLKYTMASNMENAKHTNKKSIAEKIGQA